MKNKKQIQKNTTGILEFITSLYCTFSFSINDHSHFKMNDGNRSYQAIKIHDGLSVHDLSLNKKVMKTHLLNLWKYPRAHWSVSSLWNWQHRSKQRASSSSHREEDGDRSVKCGKESGTKEKKQGEKLLGVLRQSRVILCGQSQLIH